jgi:hypothetical protein
MSPTRKFWYFAVRDPAVKGLDLAANNRFTTEEKVIGSHFVCSVFLLFQDGIRIRS